LALTLQKLRRQKKRFAAADDHEELPRLAIAIHLTSMMKTKQKWRETPRRADWDQSRRWYV